jgi:hypothetical protein
MELASILAHEPFSDRADSISSTIGAFLRTYNDGLDDVCRQNLYPVAAAIAGTAARRAVERERINRCLASCGGRVRTCRGGGRRWVWPRPRPPGRGRRGRRSRPAHTTRRCR